MRKIMIMLFFVSLAYILVFLAHLCVYLFLEDSFLATNALASKYLAYVFVALSFTFLASSFWIHMHSSIISRGAYFSSGLWHGVLFNLLLASILYWAIFYISGFIGLAFPKQIIAGILLVIALGLSAFGIWNVYHLKIRSVSLDSKVWPTAWHDKKVVMVSDVHLGEVLSVNFLKKLISDIEKQDPDIIFIPGDLFDGMDGGFDILTPELKKLRARQGVYFVNGNHETYTNKLDVKSVLDKTEIRVLNDEIVELDGVQIVGVSYPKVGERKDVAGTISRMPDYQKDKPSILLYHIPEKLEPIKQLGIDLMLSGHTHRGQMWPFNLITNAMFKGADHGLLVDGDFSIYTSSGAGVWGPTMRTSSRSEIVVFRFGSGGN